MSRVPYSPVTSLLIAFGVVGLAKVTGATWRDSHGGWIWLWLAGAWLLVGVVLWDMVRCNDRRKDTDGRLDR